MSCSLKARWFLSACLLALFGFSQADAQVIQVEEQSDVEQILRSVLGNSCADIRNVTFNVREGQFGQFEQGQSAISIERGLIMSSGKVDSISQTNRLSSTGYSYVANNQDVVGDPDLALLSNTSLSGIKDKIIIEFDFVPSDNQVKFDYVFASEEYCEFVGENKNDVFGFFLSGPGINGPYSNNAENIAQIPGTSDYISINNVNHILNTAYYIDNTPRLQQQEKLTTNCNFDNISGSVLDVDGSSINSIMFDGFTQVLTAQHQVTPGELYHLKLAISDVDDSYYDSAVFLKAKSLNTGEPVSEIQAPNKIQCDQKTVLLDGTASSSGALFQFQWFTQDGQIQSGANTSRCLVNRGGTYGLIVYKDGLDCADTSYVTVTEDPGVAILDSVAATRITCLETRSTITARHNLGNDARYQIIFPDGLPSSWFGINEDLTSTHIGVHQLILQSLSSNCLDTQNFEVTIDTLSPDASFSASYDLFDCSIDEIQLSANDVESEYRYTWSTTDGTISTDDTDWNVNALHAGTYELEITNLINGCSSTSSQEFEENKYYPMYEKSADQTILCLSDLMELQVSSDPNTSINWWTDASQSMPNPSDWNQTVEVAGTYFFEITDIATGCSVSDQIEVSWDPNVPSVEEISITAINCQNQQGEFKWKFINAPVTMEYTIQGPGVQSTKKEGDAYVVILNAPGNYLMRFNEVGSNCTYQQAFVIEDQSSEIALNMNDYQFLDCQSKTSLFAPGFSQDVVYKWYWSSAPENTLSNSQQISVYKQGSLVLEITELASQCVIRDTTRILSLSYLDTIRLDPIYRACDFENYDVVVTGLVFKDAQTKAYYNDKELAIGDTLRGIEGRIARINLVYPDCAQIRKIIIPEPDRLKVNYAYPDTIWEDQDYLISGSTNRLAHEMHVWDWSINDSLICSNCNDLSLIGNADYQLQVIFEDVYGCEHIENKMLLVHYPVHVFVPNAFSPNDDGINDALRIYTNHNVDHLVDLSIFDRWGNRAYYTEGQEELVWNGYVGSKRAEFGTFLYVVNYVDVRGIPYRTSGVVQVMH